MLYEMRILQGQFGDLIENLCTLVFMAGSIFLILSELSTFKSTSIDLLVSVDDCSFMRHSSGRSPLD
jgi:hypothetical protein